MGVDPHHGFRPHGVVTARDFLDRREDLKKLQTHLLSGTNTLLVAPRRYGKTSLIQETFRRIGRRAICIYVDLFATTSDREVAQEILTQAHLVTMTRTKRAMDWAKEFLVDLDVVFILDAKIARLEIRSPARDESRDLEATLKSLENLAVKKNRPIVVALDEFQRVLERRESRQTLASMRKVIQHQRHTTYVISGSKKDMLIGLTGDHANPFYQQLSVTELGGIPLSEFIPYAESRLQDNGISVQSEAWDRIAHWTRGNPKRTQDLLQALWIEGQKNLSAAQVDDISMAQIDSLSHALRTTLDGLAVNQMRLLKGLAAQEDETSVSVYGAEFLHETRLRSTGNAQRALEALADKGILDDNHRFTDPYLKHYLARTVHSA